MEYTKNFIINYIVEKTRCNENQADTIYAMAYELGHSNGMMDVYVYAQDLCDMVNKFMARR